MSDQGSKAESDVSQALAVLITGTRTRKRPMSLYTIADALATAVRALGSYSAVADRVGLSPKMLRQFSYVHRLVEPVQELFRTRKLDAVDAAVHLSMLSPKEQLAAARALAAGSIDGSDLRAVVQLRKVQKKAAFGQLIERVRQSKTRKQAIVEFVVRGKRSKPKMLSAIAKYIPRSEIIRLEVDGPIGRLALTRKGEAALRRAARYLGGGLADVIPTALLS